MADRHYFQRRRWYQRGTVAFTRETFRRQPLRIVPGLAECPTCGLFQRMPALQKGQIAECRRCSGQMQGGWWASPLAVPVAFCVSSAALYLALLIVPIMSLNVYGRVNVATLMTGPHFLSKEGFGLIGILVSCCSLVMPGLAIGILGCVLWAGSRKSMPHWGAVLLAWYARVRPWGMVGVYVIGLLVAYTKLVDLAVVKLLPGAYLLGALMLSMAAQDFTFDENLIWNHASLNRLGAADIHDAARMPLPPASQMLSCASCGLVFAASAEIPQTLDMGDCPRCGQILRRRKRMSLPAAFAFLLAAAVFYLPANLLPVMTYTRLGKGAPSTIIGGVIELWNYGLYYLALLILFASITVPVLKIISLTLMLAVEQWKMDWQLAALSRLYRLVVVIGRWSMIDVFMISILVAVVRFGILAHVEADPGMVFFAGVVVLTIFAADFYDPRGMWDRAGYNGCGSAAESAGGFVRRS